MQLFVLFGSLLKIGLGLDDLVINYFRVLSPMLD